MQIEYRSISEDEWPEFHQKLFSTFLEDPTEAGRERLKVRLEHDRTIAAFDMGEIVGTAGTDTFELATPGGQVAAGGLTVVSVAPTHRRRGIMTNMISHHLDDCRRRGEPVSILWAEESHIYGRFGYGPATLAANLVIPTKRVSLSVASVGAVESITVDEARKLLPPIYEQSRRRPGSLSIAPHLWAGYFEDPEEWREGRSAQRYAIYREGGEDTGYTTYRVKGDWTDDFPNGKVFVGDLHAVTPAAYGALWAYLLGHDLVEELRADLRPVAEPLDLMVDDFRRIKRTTNDGMWCQILDVNSALSSRRYQVEDTLVIEVPDHGVYRLEGGPEGAACRSVSDVKADITVTLDALSACYLGETRFGQYAQTGKAQASDEVLRRADLMFGWHERPWCPFVF